MSVLSLAEVSDWCTRNGADPLKHLVQMKRIASVLTVNEEIAEKAGSSLKLLRSKAAGIGMIDAIIYSQAATAGMKVLTGDPHFENLQGVEFIE